MKVKKIEVEPAMDTTLGPTPYCGPWDVIFTTKNGQRFKLTSDAQRINNNEDDPKRD